MIDIVYIGDASYANAIRVSAESAIRQAHDPSSVRIHVVTDDDNFPDIGYDIRRWTRVGREPWHGTELVWSRIDFALLFPECDWVVSCDGDTLWMADPAELWKHRYDRFFLQASMDVPAADGGPMPEYAWWGRMGLEMPLEKCYCCGLMLLNLKKMRAEDFSAKCISFLDIYPTPPMREQTVMCYIAKYASAPLPREWGVFSFWHTEVERPKLVHYVQDLPWKRQKINRLMSDIVLEWWKLCESIHLQDQFEGFRGCRNRIDYLWRRGVYVFLKPFACVIERIRWLRPHLRNIRGIN